MTTRVDQFQSRALTTPNHIAMAPMTCLRSSRDGLPTPSIATYYAQRASAGLVISEGLQPSIVGQSHLSSPGLCSQDQVESWKQVTGAVHANGGRIFAQITHGGRVGHVDVVGEHPIGPSNTARNSTVHTAKRPQPVPVPRALSTAEVATEARPYAHASVRTIAAGFDGVDLHGANVYLIQQFLASNLNRREDRCGGSIANRIWFAVEVAESTAEAIGVDRVALRIARRSNIWDIHETDAPDMYRELLHTLSPQPRLPPGHHDRRRRHRRASARSLGRNADAKAPSNADGHRWVDRGADFISFSRNLHAPDLVERLRSDLSLRDDDTALCYVEATRDT